MIINLIYHFTGLWFGFVEFESASSVQSTIEVISNGVTTDTFKTMFAPRKLTKI